MKSISCRLCGSHSHLFLFQKGHSHICRCRKCRLIFTAQTLNLGQIRNYYSKDYFLGSEKKLGYYDYFAEEEIIRLNSQVRIKKLKEITRRRNLLEVGCAAGFFLDEARKAGFQVSGVEISNFMAQYARKKLRLEVKNSPLSADAFTKKKFDVIALWDTIEHLNDPVKVLKEAYKLLRSNGILVLSTGNAGSFFAKISGRHWHLYTPPQHLSFFDKSTIATLLFKSNFETFRIEEEGSYYSLAYLLFALKVKLDYLHLGFLYDWLCSSKIGKLSVYLNLGDIMTVYAKKR